MKLKKLGVRALRVTDTDVDRFADAAKGEYRFGIIIRHTCSCKIRIVLLCTVLMSPKLAMKTPWRNLLSTPYFKENLVLEAYTSMI